MAELNRVPKGNLLRIDCLFIPLSSVPVGVTQAPFKFAGIREMGMPGAIDGERQGRTPSIQLHRMPFALILRAEGVTNRPSTLIMIADMKITFLINRH